MDYAKYKNVRNASWQCLLDCNIRSLPVPIGGICAFTTLMLLMIVATISAKMKAVE